MRVHVADDLLKITERNISWWTHRKRFHLYVSGLVHRGESIGKSYLLREITFNDEDVIIDCGANMGDLQLYFMNLDLPVNYIGIEPNPIDFKCLELNAPRGFKPFNVALWDKNSQMTFFVDSDSASSSLIEPPFFTEKVLVKSVRLDSLKLPDRIKLLKVEGEGAEPEILEGARGIFTKIEFITVDAGPERGINQTATRNEVIKVLRNSDFELIKENPYHRKTLLFRNQKIK